MNNINPKASLGGTPTGTRVSQILAAHIDKLDAVKGTDAYAKIKPLDLIVITDGAPSTSFSAYRLRSSPHRSPLVTLMNLCI